MLGDKDRGVRSRLSCDNIMTNGAVAREATIGAARNLDDALPAWVADHVSFPNSMVDRITPMTTPSDIEWLENTMGIIDQWPVVAEPFRQWVVEDNYAGDRLPLDELDVIVTDDIEPYELTKLRLLNAGHSCLAYLAALDRFAAVDGAMANPVSVDSSTPCWTSRPSQPSERCWNRARRLHRRTDQTLLESSGRRPIERLCLDGSANFPKFSATDHSVPDSTTADRSNSPPWRWPHVPVPGRPKPRAPSDVRLDEAVEHRPQFERHAGQLPRFRCGLQPRTLGVSSIP